MIIYKEK